MAFNYNQSVLVGRLTKDPELKVIKENISRIQFYLAVQRSYKKKDKSVDVDFIPVVLFGKLADLASQLLFKGSAVLVWGSIQVRSFHDKDNFKKWITELRADNFQLLSKITSLKENAIEQCDSKIMT